MTAITVVITATAAAAAAAAVAVAVQPPSAHTNKVPVSRGTASEVVPLRNDGGTFKLATGVQRPRHERAANRAEGRRRGSVTALWPQHAGHTIANGRNVATEPHGGLQASAGAVPGRAGSGGGRRGRGSWRQDGRHSSSGATAKAPTVATLRSLHIPRVVRRHNRPRVAALQQHAEHGVDERDFRAGASHHRSSQGVAARKRRRKSAGNPPVKRHGKSPVNCRVRCCSNSIALRALCRVALVAWTLPGVCVWR